MLEADQMTETFDIRPHV